MESQIFEGASVIKSDGDRREPVVMSKKDCALFDEGLFGSPLQEKGTEFFEGDVKTKDHTEGGHDVGFALEGCEGITDTN